MPKPLERRRKPRRKALHVTGPTWVMLENVPGARADVRAKVVDFNETGIRIHVSLLLQANHVVVVKAQADGVVPDGRARARVVDCHPLTGSGFSVGLTFEETRDRVEPGKKPAMDLYEILQVSRTADAETIHGVYRLQAQRFHPDNGGTGDAETFRAIAEAYKILGDPETRASYDAQLAPCQKSRQLVFDQGEAASGKAAERFKRREILEVLYATRQNQRGLATLSIFELEDRLGCASEHLGFSLWYLQESALISSPENGRYCITTKGVDYLESEDAAGLSNGRLLVAGG